MKQEITLDHINELNFGVGEKLPQIVRDQFQEAFEATYRIVKMLGEDWQPEIERQVTVIETGPWVTPKSRQFIILSQQEREKWVSENPDLVVRLATNDELIELSARLEGWNEE